MREFLPTALFALALLFLGWEVYGFLNWLRQTGGLSSGFNHLWQTLRTDRMALIVVADHLVIAGTVLVLMLVDAARLGWSPSRRILLAVLFVALGSPTLLVYLAWRLGSRHREALG